MTSAIISAVVSGIVAIAVSVFTAYQNTKSQTTRLEHELRLQQEKLKNEVIMQEKGLRTDVELQQERLRTELRTEFMAEAAIHQLLSKAKPKRTWEELRKRIGGFSDDDLRKLLVRSGAVRYETRGTQEELWGLIDRNEI
jgi:hypothetical protein